MSTSSLLSLKVYEVAFLAIFALLPFLAYRAQLGSYIVGILVLYICLKIIRRRMTTTLPPHNKAVFISGCDSGFGHVAAIKLETLGYTVFAGCLDENGTGAIGLKNKKSDNLQVIPLDVTSDESVRCAGIYVRDHLGDMGLWGVVNNAGILAHGDVEPSSLQMYNRVMDVNYFGAIRVTKEFLPLVRKSQGRIVMMSSIAARVSLSCSSAYAASKKALEGVSDSLRMEMTKFGVKVAIIEPSMFGGNTDVIKGKNLKRIFDDIDESWDSMSDEARSTYCKQKLQNQIHMISNINDDLKAKSPDAVVDAIIDGLSSSAPRSRYVVQGGPFWLFDPLAIYGILYNYLPEGVTDWINDKATGPIYSYQGNTRSQTTATDSVQDPTEKFS